MMEDPDRPCWFRAVAGASAGAITATLIAAGFRPEQVGDETDRAIKALRKPKLLNGLSRIHNGLSYLDQDSLLEWLQGVLEEQVDRLCGLEGGAGITFAELYGLTEVELHVVAVDLNRRRVIVFNHVQTPSCEVAHAVVASAAIPVAFEWMPLLLAGPRLGVIVDGGVMSNFPTFVFKDASFRRWAGLQPMEPSTPVVGFLLDEPADPEATRADLYRESAFVSRDDPALAKVFAGRKRFRARTTTSSSNTRVSRAFTAPFRVVGWPIRKVLLEWIPAFLRWNAGAPRANWPTPKSPSARILLNWFDAVLAGTRPWAVLLGGFTAVSLCLGVGAYVMAWRPFAHYVGELVDGRAGLAGAPLGLLFWLLWSVVPVYAWALICAVFFGAWLTYRTVSATGYGLMRTFLQSPGAPPWAGVDQGDHVVRLPVPAGITTLESSLQGEQLEEALRSARDATRAKLRELHVEQGC
jgi:predicted acylesterase/phospholipase RssA